MKTARMLGIVGAAVVVVLAGLARPAAGTTWYVDPNGFGDFNGIQAALDDPCTVDGDEIEVAPGTYYEAVDFNDKAVRLYSSGGADVTTIDANGAYHAVQCVSGEDANTILEGFTITGGNANGSDSNSWGGGMYNSGSSPTVKNCTISGNTAYEGGGMYNNGSSPTVTNCVFSGNSADYGGGLSNGNSSIPTVTNCVFSGNSATSGGGMFNHYSSSPAVTNCTFSGNTANSNGGGMRNMDSSPTVTNCTFSGNGAGNGGGMFNDYGSPMVTNCTFNGNTANSNGGGMFNMAYSSPTVTNCILWGNTAPSGPEISDDGTSSTSVSYSDVEGGTGQGWFGTGCIDADPCFVDADSNDFRLLYYSPCVDAGDNNSVPADTADLDGDGNTAEAIPFDLEGLPRLADGDGDGSAVVDMGAYESKAPPYAYAPNPADGAELVSKNPTLTWTPGLYADQHEIYFGTDETAVADANSSNTTGIYKGFQEPNSYAPAGPLVLGQTYYWKITEVNDGYVGPLTPPWEGDVWSFRVEGHAYDPSPADGEEEVPFIGPIVFWVTGTDSNSHDVYFGTSFAEVNDATTSSSEFKGKQALGDTSHDPGTLEWLTSYYWRIDEVNESAGTFLKGDVWSFTTGDFLIADDFEDYANDGELLAVWDDFGVNGSDGAIYLENDASIIREPNSQAARLEFVNWTPMGPGYIGSWFDVQDLTELDIGPDWTISGVKALTLYMRGDPCNVRVLPGGPSAPELAAGRPWVELEDTSSNAGYVLYPDANDILEDIWHEWNIDLNDAFDPCGVTLSAIDRFTIGIGGYDKTGPSGGMVDFGYIWVDDIRVYRRRCVPEYAPGVDITGEDGERDCVVDGLDLKIMAEQWLTSGPEADIVDDDIVNFEDYGILGGNWLEEFPWPPE